MGPIVANYHFKMKIADGSGAEGVGESDELAASQ
jgi:hypothetical protein